MWIGFRKKWHVFSEFIVSTEGGLLYLKSVFIIQSSVKTLWIPETAGQYLTIEGKQIPLSDNPVFLITNTFHGASS